MSSSGSDGESTVPVSLDGKLRYQNRVDKSNYTETHSAADRTHELQLSAVVATTAAVNISSYGYATAAIADGLVREHNDLVADMTDLKETVAAIINDLQGINLIT